jgi:hypothetical protein
VAKGGSNAVILTLSRLVDLREVGRWISSSRAWSGAYAGSQDVVFNGSVLPPASGMRILRLAQRNWRGSIRTMTGISLFSGGGLRSRRMKEE